MSVGGVNSISGSRPVSAGGLFSNSKELGGYGAFAGSKELAPNNSKDRTGVTSSSTDFLYQGLLQ